MHFLSIFLLVLITNVYSLQNDVDDVDASDKLVELLAIAFGNLLGLESEVQPVGLGPVFGAKSCGGSGEFVHWEVSECDTINSICRFPINVTTGFAEIQFLPSDDIEQLTQRTLVTIQGKQPKMVFQGLIPEIESFDGELKKVRLKFPVEKEFKGRNATVKQILYRDDINVTEICVQAPFQFV